jgi:hypothetical protein
MIFSLLRSLGRWKKAGGAPDASSTAHASVISYDADETAWRIIYEVITWEKRKKSSANHY